MEIGVSDFYPLGETSKVWGLMDVEGVEGG